MDNLTHTLIGATMAKAGLEKKFGKGTLLTLILASNLPDLDALWAFWKGGGDAFLMRRMFTHSLLGLPILSFLLAFIISRFNKNIKLAPLFLLSLIGMGGHIFFDLVNSYGVVLLYPFSRHRFELSWIFIIDLTLWAIMLIPFLVRWAFGKKVKLERLCQVSASLTVFYVGICALGHYHGEKILREESRIENLSPSFSYVFPEALGCNRFRGILRTGETYHVYLLHVFQDRADPVTEIKTDENSPLVAKVRETPMAKELEWFAKAPVWKVNNEGAEVWDLRFMSAVLKSRRPHFAFQFDKDGKFIGRGNF